MRLFVGIPLPEDVLEGLRRVVLDWKACIGGVKYVEPENMHITLKFIGEVNDRRAERIATLLEEVPFTPITVGLEGMGAFPSLDRPRVVWVGVRDGFEEIVRLSVQIDGILSLEGVPRETRAFHPHETIGSTQKTVVGKYSPKYQCS
ncbi:TPA: RNA 2',3'-cyclic phosphodiesterase [Candidatus Micrarchaeota archaeon]|nr:RNA 2',3'-cyclic phosphodiesterase [Candidatus Micrarchaeota archaeon]